MRLLRLSDVETSSRDRIFYYSRTHVLLIVFVAVGASAWLLFRAFTMHWKPGYYFAPVILLFLCLMQRLITARFRPSNWLVRMSDSGLFIKFRSYLNYHLPAEDLTVVFVSYQEIRSARLIRERVEVPDAQGHTSTQFLRYIELELGGDTGPLADALQTEIAERAPNEKHWYGSSSTLYEDHPVRMASPSFLQLRWQVVPGPRKFLEAIRPWATIADPVSMSQDFAHLQGLSRDDQQKQLRELAQRGETIAAIYTARKLYRCSLAEARAMVEGFQKQPVS
jgi:hypothetical protein